jgi:hypothetical protein
MDAHTRPPTDYCTITGLTIAGYLHVLYSIVLYRPVHYPVLKGYPTWQVRAGGGDMGLLTVSCFAFTRLQHFLLFGKASPLRLATPTLHRLRRQTNMATDHTTPPLRSLAVFLSGRCSSSETQGK